MYAVSYTDPTKNGGYNTQTKTVDTRREANKLRKALLARGIRPESITIECMINARFHV